MLEKVKLKAMEKMIKHFPYAALKDFAAKKKFADRIMNEDFLRKADEKLRLYCFHGIRHFDEENYELKNVYEYTDKQVDEYKEFLYAFQTVTLRIADTVFHCWKEGLDYPESESSLICNKKKNYKFGKSVIELMNAIYGYEDGYLTFDFDELYPEDDDEDDDEDNWYDSEGNFIYDEDDYVDKDYHRDIETLVYLIIKIIADACVWRPTDEDYYGKNMLFSFLDKCAEDIDRELASQIHAEKIVEALEKGDIDITVIDSHLFNK